MEDNKIKDWILHIITFILAINTLIFWVFVIFILMKSTKEQVIIQNSSIGLIFSSIGTIVLVITAFFTRQAAKATKDNTEALLFQNILNEYSSDEMCDDLMLLEDWKGNKTETQFIELVKSFGKNRFTGDLKDVDYARRRVKHYFTNAFNIYNMEKLPKNLIEFIFEQQGVFILFGVVEPLEKSISDVLGTKYRPIFNDMFDLTKKLNPGIKRTVDEIYKVNDK